MKKARFLGLVVVAALAVMALVGAGSASATVLCKTNTNPCTERYPSETPLKAELTGGNQLVFTSGFAVEKCKQATMSGKTTGEGGEGKGVTALIEAATVSNCACNLGGSVLWVAQHLPWEAEFTWSENSDGKMWVGGEQWKKFCGGEGCDYIMTGSASVKGGNPAQVVVKSSLVRQTGESGIFCSNTATLSATYTLTEPAPLYVKSQ